MGETEYRAVWVEKPDRSALSHHGIKGMKWGVRRTDAQLGHDIPSGGGGGGAIDPDSIPDEFKDEIESLAETDFSKEELAKLVSGERVIQNREEPGPNGTKYFYRDVYYRDGDQLKYSSQRGTVDRRGNYKPNPNGAINTTLENADGSAPFKKLKPTGKKMYLRSDNADGSTTLTRKKGAVTHRVTVGRAGESKSGKRFDRNGNQIQ